VVGRTLPAYAMVTCPPGYDSGGEVTTTTGLHLADHLADFLSVSELPSVSADHIPAKNTFIHFPVDEPPRREELLRCRTDPTPRPPASSAASSRCASPSASHLPPPSVASPSPRQASSAASNAEASACGHSVLPFVEEIQWDMVRATHQLGSSSPTITKTLWPLRHRGLPDTSFVLTLQAKQQSKRRGKSCFRASRGVGFIQVKCCNAMCDRDVNLWITVGRETFPGEPGQLAVHNFARNPVYRINREWHFNSLVDQNTGTLKIVLGLSWEGLLLSSCPAAPSSFVPQDAEEVDVGWTDPGGPQLGRPFFQD